MVYGLAPSAYLAIRTLRKLAEDFQSDFPAAATAILQQTYVDDVLTGFDSLQGCLCLKLKDDLVSLLSKGCFELKKFMSNSPEFLASVPFEDREKTLQFNDDSCNVKILGLSWNPSSDNFFYKVSPFQDKCTKRKILSYICRIFDPLGFLSPIILLAKRFIQKLWLLGCGYDEEIPADLQSEWLHFAEEFPLLSQIRIPRKLYFPDASFNLLGFCDGSEAGYGASLYLHVTFPDSTAKCFLLVAKSKVSPLKTQTIPRMELSGAYLLTQLVKSTKCILPYSIQETFLFTDSNIVLCWLHTSPHLLKTFVANRVSQIMEHSSPSDWRHISGDINPADPVSRGLSPSQLLDHSLYWNGPPFALSPVSVWCKQDSTDSLSHDELPELKKVTLALHASDSNSNSLTQFLEKVSSLSKAQRVMAYVFRFIHNCRNPKARKLSPLSCSELHHSLLACCKLTQQHYFPEELECIKKKKILPKAFQKLSPFIDSVGICRVGGRLAHSHLSYGSKFPILLPKQARLSELICSHYHRLTCHSGPTAVQALIQTKFWIFSLRSLLRHVIFICLQCYRLKAKPPQPFMADLPPARSQPSRVFAHSATDFAGPFLVKESNRRNNRHHTKAYLCIFVDLPTKAVHLELVSQLSTEAFMACFDRFVARRGLPLTVTSDNGTNYQGSARELKEAQQFLIENEEKIFSSLASRQIKWKFNPPNAPNFGGLFEAAVKSAKTLMYRLIGDTLFTYEELSTIFTRIEAVLNSRPLCMLPSTPDEGTDYLSPGHFLVGGPLLSLPEETLPEGVTLRSRWLRLRQISQAFWRRWSTEYLQTQIQRMKWSKDLPNLEVGQVVFLAKLDSSPLSWPIGRVTAVSPGPDGRVRVATVKTATSVFVRPVNKLVPLPFSS